MSTITLEVPAEIAARAATPEGMARAQAAVLAAFQEQIETSTRQKRLEALEKARKEIAKLMTNHTNVIQGNGREVIYEDEV